MLTWLMNMGLAAGDGVVVISTPEDLLIRPPKQFVLPYTELDTTAHQKTEPVRKYRNGN